MIAEAKQQIRWKHNLPRPVELILEILIFILVLFVSYFVFANILTAIGLIPFVLLDESFTGMLGAFGSGSTVTLDSALIDQVTERVINHPATTIVSLFATLGSIGGVIIYCRAIERRRLATLGFRRGHALREYLAGALIGGVLFGLVVLICLITGTLSYEGLAHGAIGLIVLFFLGFMVQGLSEELLCRGYFMVSLARKQSLVVAIIVSSSFFGALHLLNPGVHALAVANVILFGCFAAVYLLKRGNIWGAAAIHSVWNFVQGNIFGIQVSGTAKAESVFLFEPTSTGTLINGGAFGLEGGIATTIVLAAALIVALLMKCKDPALTSQESQ
jgi:membrane protease YdiL (CAAX protease family)